MMLRFWNLGIFVWFTPSWRLYSAYELMKLVAEKVNENHIKKRI